MSLEAVSIKKRKVPTKQRQLVMAAPMVPISGHVNALKKKSLRLLEEIGKATSSLLELQE